MATSNITNLTNIKELGDAGPGGTRLGKAATELVSFYGATPIVQPTVVTTLSTSVPVSSTSGVFGFATSAQAIALTAAVNSIMDKLKALGLMASA